MQRLLKFLVPVIAIVLGIVAIVSGAKLYSQKDLYDTPAKAVIVDIQEEWVSEGDDTHLETTVYVDYEADGVKYEHVQYPGSNSGMKIGDELDIVYQSSNPAEFYTPNVGGSAVLFIVIGAVVTLGGCIGMVMTVIRRR